jgi:hypothetical protein
MTSEQRRRMGHVAMLLVIVLWAARLWAQPVEQPDTGAAEPGSDTVLSTQLVVSYVMVQILELLKRLKSVPVVGMGVTKANRVVAALLAALGTVGISATFDGATSTLVITGLSFAAIVGILVEFGRSWVFQQLIYRNLVDPKTPTPVTATLADPA